MAENQVCVSRGMDEAGRRRSVGTSPRHPLMRASTALGLACLLTVAGVGCGSDGKSDGQGSAGTGQAAAGSAGTGGSGGGQAGTGNAGTPGAGTGGGSGSGTGGGSGGAGGAVDPPPVPGECQSLSGTVTSLDAGTYCVEGDVIVPAGTLLDIPPGTTFVFEGRYHFGRDPSLPDTESAVSGGIRAVGTADKPIVFQGRTAETGWFGIIVSHSDQPVHFEYVTIRDTYKDDRDPNSRIWRRGGGLNSYVNNAGTIIRHCTFINNRAWSIAGALAINSHGQWPDAGPVEITDSVFEHNLCECGVYSGSDTDLCGGGAIRFSHVGGDAALVKIENNVFRYNEARKTAEDDAYGGAIGGFDDSIILGPGNVFEGNVATTRDGAISCGAQTSLGSIIDAVDESVQFLDNSPDNGCGL